MKPTSETTALALAGQDPIEAYIVGSLCFTPVYHVKHNQQYVEVRGYAPGISQPAMKIFRMVHAYRNESHPDNLLEVSFQDEVNILEEDGTPDIMHRWQVNFTIFVNRETYEFVRIHERPKGHGDDFFRSVAVFNELSQKKGSRLYAGDWRFESDGTGWVKEGVAPSLSKPMEALVPWA